MEETTSAVEGTLYQSLERDFREAGIIMHK
jgi:hypothetical protein